jgi:hypothetical protein
MEPLIDEAHFRKNFDPEKLSIDDGFDLVVGLIANLIHETEELHRCLATIGCPYPLDHLDGRELWVSDPAVENAIHNIKGLAAVMGANRLRVGAGDALFRCRIIRSGIPLSGIRNLIEISQATVKTLLLTIVADERATS